MQSRAPEAKRYFQSIDVAQRGFQVGKNIQFVVEAELCHGCGSCEAICPRDAIAMRYDERAGIYLPEISDQLCQSCGLCIEVCSGFELDLELFRRHEPGISQHPLVGPHVGIHRAHSTHAERWERASSGGMVTEIAGFLLDTGRVDGVMVTGMHPDAPLEACGYIARHSNELVRSQKSKYCPTALNTLLKPIIEGDLVGRFAFVGLPHNVHGLRLMQRIYPELVTSIPYVIALFTSHVSSQIATEFTLFHLGIEAEDVERIEYRGGGNPGRMRIVTRDGAEHLVPHLHWAYYGHAFPQFYYPVREWLYFDKVAEWADFSCGDNWMGGLAEQRGMSTVVTRCTAAEDILQDMVSAGRVWSRPMTPEELVIDQGLTRKLNIKSRLWAWRWLGRPVPIYTREFDDTNHRPLGSLRFALNVLLSARNPPFPLMKQVIRLDYYLRARPGRVLRRVFRFIRLGLTSVLPYRAPESPSGKALKIVLIGGYGFEDIGDESMPHAVRLNLRQRFGVPLDIVMLSPYPGATANRHGERSVSDFTLISYSGNARFLRRVSVAFCTAFLLAAVRLEKWGIPLRLWNSARQALDEIGGADLIYNVGGGNVNTVIPYEFYKKCTTYLVASILGKPVYLSGQTMGPYRGRFERWYARHCINRVRAISFRDSRTSHQRLHEIGVDRPLMFDAADDAITLQGIPRAAGRELLVAEMGEEHLGDDSGMLIFMNLKSSLQYFKDHGVATTLEHEVALLADIADALKDHFECTLVFVATDFTPGVDDRVCHEQVVSRMKHGQGVYSLQGEYTDEELIGMIRNADLVIGSRYHFNVFAAICHVPFLGLASGEYQRTKLKGLADLCGLPECYVDQEMGEASVLEVWPRVENIIGSRRGIREKLRAVVPEMRNNSLKLLDIVAQDLQTRGNRG